MMPKFFRSVSSRHNVRNLVAILCALLLVSGQTVVPAGMTKQSQQEAANSQQEKIPADQLDSLVAPIAIYPDQLLSQVLVASTYPLELVQLQQWLSKNQNLKDKALVDAVSKQPWDPSIQAMAALPEVVKRLTDDIQWTTDLGNAFLAQQSDVMDAVQRMRKKAQDAGALKSNEQQKVETKVVESKEVIVVEQANPQVVYVPSYNPTVVYGAPVYPYPPIYYPPSTGAVIAASAISFGVGVAMGAMWGGGWGWGCGWGHNDVNINVNNNFNRNANINNVRGGNRASNTRNTWQHNPQHRGGTPYANKATADRFGGTARGDSMSNRQASARQQVSRQGGNLGSTGSRAGGAGVSDRAGAGANRPGGAGVSDRAGAGGNRAGGAGVSDRSMGGGGGGGDRIGSHNIPSSSGGANRSALGGGTGDYSGSSARASSSRGSSSMGSSRGGGAGMRGGGGGRGGGGRRR
jgi:Protein of unknown function (DUF3300)